MISYDEAQKLIGAEFARIERAREEVPLLLSLGRSVAEDIAADTNLPPFDHSAMDGYAVTHAHDRRSWTITGEITAGNFRDIAVRRADAVSVMTGSALPFGADTVIPIEDAVVKGTTMELSPNARYAKGMNIRRCGEDLSAGMIAVERRTIIRPNTIALLAACGKTSVPVIKRLTAGILCSGDELIDIAQTPHGDKIRATNLYAILAAGNDSLLNTFNFGLTSDARPALKKTLSSILNEAGLDMLITTGGVSVGVHDYIREILIELGAEIIFWRVNIKPGKPMLFAKFQTNGKAKYIFGLPGTPVSAFTAFSLFIAPHVRAHYYREQFHMRVAELQEPLSKKDGKRHFILGRIHYDAQEERYVVASTGAQSSGNMAALALANCFIVLKEPSHEFHHGDRVECIMI